MAIKIDFTRHSVVALCTECGWRTVRATREAGHRAGADHCRDMHAGAAGNPSAAARMASLRARKRPDGSE